MYGENEEGYGEKIYRNLQLFGRHKAVIAFINNVHNEKKMLYKKAVIHMNTAVNICTDAIICVGEEKI